MTTPSPAAPPEGERPTDEWRPSSTRRLDDRREGAIRRGNETAPDAQPDEAAGLVEKCARAMADAAFVAGEAMHGYVDLGEGMRDFWRGLAAIALSVLDPAIREQIAREQAPLFLTAVSEAMQIYSAVDRARTARGALTRFRAAIARGQQPDG